MTFRIVGRVVDADTGDGIGGLLVEGWDADLVFDDLVGSAPTDATGGFFMEFDEGYFRELFFDRKPDLYFEIHHRGRVVYTTKGVVEWNLDIGETWIVIELERHLLGDGHDPSRPIYPDPRQRPDVSPVDPVHPGPRVHPPRSGQWKDAIGEWWTRRKRERADDGTLHVPTRPIPKPFLGCTSNFGPQVSALALNQPGNVSLTVRNDGNAPSWTCYVELYEGPWGYIHPLGDYQLRGRAIVSLCPGERRDVLVPWVRRESAARIVGIVFDPLLDPKDFALVGQHDRHVTSVHYSL
jgi:hypothetical protein